jgi:hypothetical protein
VRLRSSPEIPARRRHAHCVDAPVTDFESVTTEPFTQPMAECFSSWSSHLVIDGTPSRKGGGGRLERDHSARSHQWVVSNLG